MMRRAILVSRWKEWQCRMDVMSSWPKEIRGSCQQSRCLAPETIGNGKRKGRTSTERKVAAVQYENQFNSGRRTVLDGAWYVGTEYSLTSTDHETRSCLRLKLASASLKSDFDSGVFRSAQTSKSPTAIELDKLSRRRYSPPQLVRPRLALARARCIL
jgi:hypothetical protein